MDKDKIIEQFTIGGIYGNISMPSGRMIKYFGSVIKVDWQKQQLFVPTKHGVIKATKGDTVVMYEDQSFGVIGSK